MVRGDCSLRPRERLKGSLRFRSIKREHRALWGATLLVHVVPNGLRYNRIGISVSAKSIPGSTRRNRLKRLIREAYRRNKNKLQGGFDIVVRARKTGMQRSLGQVEKELIGLLKKDHILK